MTIHDELREVMGLLGKATPGPWEWSVNGNIIPVPYGDTEIAAVYSEHEDDRAPANAEAIIAAVAFLRQHGPALLARQEGEDRHEVMCSSCGKPTMHLGPLCFSCTKARSAARSGGGG